MLPPARELRRCMALREVPPAMKSQTSTDPECLRWTEVQTRVIELSRTSGFEAAIGEVNAFLGQSPPLDLERQAIGFRGDLRSEQNDLQGAREDYLIARSLSEEVDFERFTLDLAIGVVSEQLGDTVDAERWFIAALESAAEDPTTCGISALKHLSRLRNSFELSPEERRLAERVVAQGWRVLRLPGSPDLSDLWASARRVSQAQGKPLPPSEES